MKLALYERFSSDNQRETSIEDQRRIMQRWAKRWSHETVADFSDSGISGASLNNRPGLQALLQAALSTPAPFEAVVVDQLSRLSRDVGETDFIIKRLKFAGVRVVAINDGIDTSEETTKISVTVKSLVNELFLDDLKKTTKRGLDGQFLKGFSTGGRTFGFRSEPVYDASGKTDPRGLPIPIGYRVVVAPEEAEIAREIFMRFRNGECEKTIARALNACHRGRTWRPNTIYYMLQNPKFIGHFHFNRREWRKNPETGRRVCRLRPRQQWEERVVEDLRIVDQATWEAVQARLRTRQRLFSHAKQRSTHLLSGLLICDQCNGRLTIVGKDYYACRNHVELGNCANDIRIHRATIEQVVLSEFARHLPAYIDQLYQAAIQTTHERTRQAGQDRQGLEDLRREAEAIMAAVRQGRIQGRALEEAMATYQRVWERVEVLEREAQLGRRASGVTEVRYDREVLKDFVASLPTALRADVPQGRELLNETLESIRVTKTGNHRPACPVCGKAFPKLTVQHLATHGLTFEEAYRRYPAEIGRASCRERV